MTDAIELRGVRLSYTFHSRAGGSMKEHAINLFRREGYRNTVWALDGVDLAVAPGDVLGVIGPNGAGKSTMMKLIARVLQPTEGRVIVRGSVGAMISLGAGFDKDATARENIILYGTLLGRTPAEMRRRVEPILEWADLTDHIHAPLRTFSSGMVARLGFSVASDSVADVLIVDEVLSVGDRAFRRKSEERMRSMVSRGSAVVIVSHSMNTIRALCTNVVWLEAGRVHMLGPADEVVDAYEGPDSESDQVLKRARNAPGPARRTRRLGRENPPPRRARPQPTDEPVVTEGRVVGSSVALGAGGDSEEAPRRRRGAQGHRAAKDVAVVTDAAAVSVPTVRPPITEKEPVSGKPHVLIPESLDDVRLLVDFLRDGVLVVLDLRKITPDEVRRVVDFAIGVAYGLGATMRKLGPGVVLVTPANTEVGQEERRRLIDLGYLEPSDEA